MPGLDESALVNLPDSSRIQLEPTVTGNRPQLDAKDVSSRTREAEVTEGCFPHLLAPESSEVDGIELARHRCARRSGDGRMRLSLPRTRPEDLDADPVLCHMELKMVGAIGFEPMTYTAESCNV